MLTGADVDGDVATVSASIDVVMMLESRLELLAVSAGSGALEMLGWWRFGVESVVGSGNSAATAELVVSVSIEVIELESD